jgi:hypothetical protein
MKFNKWTLGLAALGVVSLGSVAQAEESMSAVQSALSSTTISGYVDTSAQWNFGDQGPFMPPYGFGGTAKADGFNLNVVQLTIAKPLDEGEWAAGYRADIWMGPDAVALASQFSGSGDLAIRQAYVALRAPIGNGLDFKIGVFDTIVGYETLESGANPNFTRSYGFTIEPTTHTGILATYRFSDVVSASFGIADSFGPTVNGRSNPPMAESYKTYMGSLALTAPSDWGWAAGSTFYLGVINGYNTAIASPYSFSGGNGVETHWYAGATLATPVAGLKVGASLDYLDVYHGNSSPFVPLDHIIVLGGYVSYQATEKLSFHGRGEYMNERVFGTDVDSYELTLTAQYDLWANVISRLEFRWDHSDNFGIFGPNFNLKNATMIAANVIYKF